MPILMKKKILVFYSQKKGPIDMYLTLSPNSYVETNISENDGMRAIKKVKGSISTNEYIENSINSSRLNAKKKRLIRPAIYARIIRYR